MAAQIPKALEPGDTIALVCPASTPAPAAIERAIQVLQLRGYRVKTYGDLYRRHGYLAGDDQLRADELMAAWLDDEVAAILPARGGYGVARILHQLDYPQIARHPKILAGYSDITALHLALRTMTSLVTFHSPHPQDGMGAADGWDPRSQRSFWQTLEGPGQAPGDRLVDARVDSPLDAATAEPAEGTELRALRPGRAEGVLIGGNLAVLAGMLGTPFAPDTRDQILFLEDVGEPPYRIDRFLAQLQLAGKLEPLAGVMLGHFTDCQPQPDRPSLSLEEVWDHYFGRLGVPVVTGIPCGHARPNLTLPLGIRVELDADSRRVTVLESPVR